LQLFGEVEIGGERGIRTPGTILLVQRFSKPPLSATQPSLLHVACGTLFYRRKVAPGQVELSPVEIENPNAEVEARFREELLYRGENR
jgi:hypothetical protein